jgi:hypothetical protein
VPFCSKCLDACMRANNALSGFEKDHVRELTALVRTVRSMRADGPLPLQKVWWKAYVAGGRSGPHVRTVRHSNSFLFQKGCSLVRLVVCSADGPLLGRGRSAGLLII